MLKKEFNVKDVTRLRNIVRGKLYDKSATGVGYTKKEVIHSEGDVWEENDQTWTIKDGIKQNVTKLDAVKKLAHFPLFCPSCNKVMKHRNDKTMFYNHRKCFNCMVEYETKLRQLGLWDEYEKQIINEGIDRFIEGYKLWVESAIKQSNSSIITEQGDIQNWEGTLNTEQIQQGMDETIIYLNSLKK